MLLDNPMSQTFQLKYLFGVHYSDGSEFFQTPDDVSATDPIRSAFYDVDLDRVELFQLEGDGHKYLVDLRDGHFEIDGLPFIAGDPRVQPIGQELRLVYFRRHRESQHSDGTTSSAPVEYHFGWQFTVDGKNYQQTLAVT